MIRLSMKCWKRKSFILSSIEQNEIKIKTFKKSKISIFKGLFLAMSSSFFFSLTAGMVKDMKNLDPGQLAMYRFLFIVALCLPNSVQCGENLFGPRNTRHLILLRGICNAMNSFLNFTAFRFLPLGEATIIMFASPIVITIAARIFLKEPCGWFQSVSVILAGIGIIFSTKVPVLLSGNLTSFSTEFVYGVSAALASLFFKVAQILILKKLHSVHHSIINFNASWVAFIHTSVITALIGEFKWHHCGTQSFFIILIGFLSYAAQTCMALSVKCESVGPVSTIRSSMNVAFAFLGQIFVFRDIPDTLSIIGVILIGISIISTGMIKWVASMNVNSSEYRSLRWMLF